MKNELDVLNEVLERTITRYEKMLSAFLPCQPEKGEFLEQNLVTNFAIEFVKTFPKNDVNVYTEVPFKCIGETKGQCHIDLYIQNEDVGYLIEAKGNISGIKFLKEINKDIARIKSDELHNSFLDILTFLNKRSNRNVTLPKKMYGVIIADYWASKNDDKFIYTWNSNLFDVEKFSNIVETTTINAKEVALPYQSDYRYWFLARMFELNWD